MVKWTHNQTVQRRPSGKITLSFSAQFVSVQQSNILVFLKGVGGALDVIVGETDTQPSSGGSVVYAPPLNVDYFFEEMQVLRICLKEGVKTIDEVTVSLASIIGLEGGNTFTWTQKLLHSGVVITVNCAEVPQNEYDMTIALKGEKLDKKDWFGKSDPYLVVSKDDGDEDGSAATVLYKTEIVMKTLNPEWKPMTFNTATINPDVKLKIECFDWDKGDKHDEIGSFRATLRELTVTGASFTLHHHKHPDKSAGTIKVASGSMVRSPTFLEFMRSGLTVRLVMAVDYTMSNGEIKYPNSLHYLEPGKENPYQQAMAAVTKVLLPYDNDKRIQAYGFGCKLNGEPTHAFALNGNEQAPDVDGLEGLLSAYVAATSKVVLFGPTNFAPILRKAEEMIKANRDEYVILVFLTDGVITDFDETLAAIVRLSMMPVSIVIVGVGDADFSQMVEIDSDNALLKDRAGNEAKRDIVQFVGYNKFKAASLGLAAELLSEIPAQFVSYARVTGKQPKAF